jgi:hypothetical protein
VVQLPEPDLNIVSFLLHHPSLATLTELNALNEMIYGELSPNAKMPAPYMITRTTLTSPGYDGALEPLISLLGGDGRGYRETIAEGLTVLRATVMNPFSGEGNSDCFLGLAGAVHQVAMRFPTPQPAGVACPVSNTLGREVGAMSP